MYSTVLYKNLSRISELGLMLCIEKSCDNFLATDFIFSKFQLT
eukprot:UN14639